MKLANCTKSEKVAMSHPTWVRGLKLKNRLRLLACTSVAPYVGAWIETKTATRPPSVTRVAPYVGAWIETGECG